MLQPTTVGSVGNGTASKLVWLAGLIGLLAAATLAGAWAFQWQGYVPCELCLKERIPYYAGVPLALAVAFLAWVGRTALLSGGFVALSAIFAAGAAVAAYHTGVEWHLWAGPASCTGSFAAPARVGDFLSQLQSINIVRCDAAALHVLGLSLAAWDALICALLAVLALLGAQRAART
jgi:disulfide bond formation protein DsbB